MSLLLLLLACLASAAADSVPQSARHAFGRLAVQTLNSASSLLALGALSTSVLAAEQSVSVLDYKVMNEGAPTPMSSLVGRKGTLVVNVASQCALTPQYAELVALYDKYSEQGFQILAFPCNQFGNQEPADVSKVRRDMKERFGVRFPILDKVDVNGADEAPLFAALKSVRGIGVSNIQKISWNFEKFLLDSNGAPIRRYKPGILPSEIDGDVKSLVKTGTIPERKKASLNNY